MKKEELFEVLGNLEPGMVEKARSDRHPRRGVWKKWTAAAACAVIIGGAVLGVHSPHGNPKSLRLILHCGCLSFQNTMPSMLCFSR